MYISRCNAEVVIGNLFKLFDPDNSGSVVPTELLVAFSMSMKGTVEDKLRWVAIDQEQWSSDNLDRWTDPQQPASVSRSHNRVTNIYTTVTGDGNNLSGGNAAGRDISQHQDIYTVALIVVLVAVFFALIFNLIRFL